jgi:hypothetical protein
MAFTVVCFAASSAGADYPHVSRTAIAGSNSYHVADRPNGAEFIDSIMIHDTEETYDGTVAAFTDPNAGASTQYAVSGEDGSSDPAVTQFVADKNWTKNVNNFWFNQHSIGIESIGFAVAPAGYFTRELYQRVADLVGWAVWKYRIPLDRAHILGHDNIPNSVNNPHVQHWDPGPSWDWPYFMDLVRSAYERWSHDARTPPAEIPERYTKRNPRIRRISVGDKFDSARDSILWTTGHQNAFTNVYAGRDEPELSTLVRGASSPSTYRPSRVPDGVPTYNQLDFSCDNFPWGLVPNAPTVLSQVSAGDLRAKAGWGQEFALRDRKRVDGVLYDKIDFNGTAGWVRASDTSDGWGALVRFRGGTHPTELFSGPEYPANYPFAAAPLDTRICPDTDAGLPPPSDTGEGGTIAFGTRRNASRSAQSRTKRRPFARSGQLGTMTGFRAGQTYVARIRRFSQGREWYQIDYNHRVAWVPADEVEVLAP